MDATAVYDIPLYTIIGESYTFRYKTDEVFTLERAKEHLQRHYFSGIIVDDSTKRCVYRGNVTPEEEREWLIDYFC